MPRKKDDYEDYFERVFKEADVEDAILEEGGQLSFENFKQASKKHLKKDYYEYAFDHPFAKSTKNVDKLGKTIFERHFEGKSPYLAQKTILKRNPEVALNKSNRFVVAKGQIIEFGGKRRTGGQFLPKDYFASRSTFF